MNDRHTNETKKILRDQCKGLNEFFRLCDEFVASAKKAGYKGNSVAELLCNVQSMCYSEEQFKALFECDWNSTIEDSKDKK